VPMSRSLSGTPWGERRGDLRTGVVGLQTDHMEPKKISFEEAVAETENKRRHRLPGNGFSISKDGRFDYRRLYDVAAKRRPLSGLRTRRTRPGFGGGW
jgi:hypothetical protein